MDWGVGFGIEEGVEMEGCGSGSEWMGEWGEGEKKRQGWRDGDWVMREKSQG